MNRNANKCIKCDVVQCKNHCQDVDYCALDVIKIGTHEDDPKICQCTDCESFEKREL